MIRRLLLLCVLPCSVVSQPSYFCIGGASFSTSELARRAGLSCIVKVTFDVRNFAPTNVALSPTDKACGEILSTVTIQNLGRITFLSDTNGASISFHYEHLSPRWVSGDYARVLSDSVIDLVFRSPTGLYLVQESVGKQIPQTGDTIVWSSMVIGTPVTSAKSQITVERIFRDGRDSSVILENNHPELIAEILAAAKQFDLDWFVYLQYPDLPASMISREQKQHALKKKYVVRFKVLRRLPSCNWQTEL